jgi:hypothetical protein
MYVLNTFKVDNREYSATDAECIIPVSRYGLEAGFYGGRVKYVGKTNTDVLLLMSDANTAIDTAVEKLENMPLEVIQDLLKKRKIDFHHKTGKDKLIRLLGGDKDDEEG